MTSNLSPSMQQQATSAVEPMEWLFGQLFGNYGSAFTSKYGSGAMVNGRDTGIENTKAVWRENIRANGLKLSDIKRGLAACGKFVPTWPEFLELCRPTPNADAALIEAIAQLYARNQAKDVWSHPAIYWAAQKVGYYEMTTMTTSALKPRFSAALDEVMRQEVVPPVPPAVREEFRLEHAQPANTSAEDVARAKSLIATFVNEAVKKNGAPVDGLRWAKRILANREKHSLLQIRFAEEAMRNVAAGHRE